MGLLINDCIAPKMEPAKNSCLIGHEGLAHHDNVACPRQNTLCFVGLSTWFTMPTKRASSTKYQGLLAFCISNYLRPASKIARLKYPLIQPVLGLV